MGGSGVRRVVTAFLAFFAVLYLADPLAAAKSAPSLDSPLQPQACLTPRDNLRINATSILCAGTYLVPDDAFTPSQSTYGVLRINNNSLTLDCNGAILDGRSGGIPGDGAGIYNPGFASVVIKNCILRDYGNFGSGIEVFNASNNLLTNNSIRSNASTSQDPSRCIFLRNTTQINITNNTLSCGSLGFNGASAGLYLFNSTRTVAQDNIIRNVFMGFDIPFTGGIVLEASHNNTLQRNNVTNSSFHGVYVVNSRSNLLTANTVRANPQYGIRLSNANTSAINNNEVCGNLLADFNITAAASSTGDNNRCDLPDGWNDAGTTGCTFGCGCAFTVATGTGTGTATFYTDGCNVIAGLRARNASGVPGEQPPLQFPHGFFAFNVTGVSPGAAITLTVVLPQNLPQQSQYWVFGPTTVNLTPHWYTVPIASNDGDTLITVTLTDGGPGDDDLLADGKISDVGGPATTCIVPTDDLRINQSAQLCPGSYRINDTGSPGVIIINAPSVNVSCNNTFLSGQETGRGFSISGFHNITVEGCHVSDYDIAVYFANSSRNSIADNLFSSSRIGLYMLHSSHNRIRETSTWTNSETGFLALNVNLSNITRSNFINANRVAARLAGSHGNKFTTSDFEDSRQEGLIVENRSANNSFRLDNFTNNEVGARLQSSTENNFTDSNFTGNNQTGLFVNASGFNRIRENAFSGNRAGLVAANGSDNNTIDANEANNNILLDAELSADSHGNAGCNKARDILDYNDNQVHTNLFEPFNLRVNTTLCLRSYFVNDPGGGVIGFSADNITLDCNNGSLDGNFSGTAIHLSFSDNGITVKNCRIRQYETGISLDSGPRNNTILNNSLTQVDTGIAIKYGSQFNDVLANTVAADSDGVLIYSASDNTVRNNSITVEGMPNTTVGSGVRLADGAQNNTVFGNVITNSPNGIHAHLNANQNVLDGNLIFWDRPDAHAWLFHNVTVGIWVENSTRTVAANNTIINMTRAGVLLDGSSRASVRGNSITNVTFGEGISLLNGSNASNLSENVVRDTMVGLRLEHAGAARLVRNDLGRGNYGIRLVNSSGNDLANNTAEFNGIYGLQFLNATGNEVTYSRFCYSGGTDIFDGEPDPDANTGFTNTCETSYGWDDEFFPGRCMFGCPECDNGIWDEGEFGIDCGGVCHEPCPACIPVVDNGPSDEKVDVVFVPDEASYKDPGTGGLAQANFSEEVRVFLETGYMREPFLNSSLCKFNFWYVADFGDYNNGSCPPGLGDARILCPHADQVGLIRVNVPGTKDHGCGDDFSTRAPRNAVHEMGHSLFGLADEYYPANTVGRSCPNTFGNLTDCQAYAGANGLNASLCFNHCPQAKCWPNTAEAVTNCTTQVTNDTLLNNGSKWKNDTTLCNCTEFATNRSLNASFCQPIDAADCAPFWQVFWKKIGVTDPAAFTLQSPDWCDWFDGWTACCDPPAWNVDSHAFNPDNSSGCMMSSWGSANFGPADQICIQRNLSTLPDCAGAATSTATQQNPYAKAVVVYANINNSNVTKTQVAAVYGGAPNHFAEHEEFSVSAKAAAGTLLESFTIEDPRLVRITPDEGDFMGLEPLFSFNPKADFAFVLKFSTMLNRIEVWQGSALLGALDVQSELHQFCLGHLLDPECQALDTDGDGVFNLQDNCPFAANPPPQTDADADGFGAACDCNDANAGINPGQRERCWNDADDDCDGVVNDGCRTGSPVFKKPPQQVSPAE